MGVNYDHYLDQKFDEWQREGEYFEALSDAFDEFLKENDWLSEEDKKELEAQFLSNPEDFFKEW